MTRRDQKALMEYCRWVANDVGLRDWTLHFDWDHDAGHNLRENSPSDSDDAAASIEAIYGRRHAVLRFSNEFRDFAPGKQRHYVVHELMHLHLARLEDYVSTDLKALLARPAWDVLLASFERDLEYAVDALADVLAGRLPKVTWPG